MADLRAPRFAIRLSPVLAQILADVLDRVELRGAQKQEDRDDIVGHVEPACGVPSGPVEQQDGMGPAATLREISSR
jgi:hypothetical protein